VHGLSGSEIKDILIEVMHVSKEGEKLEKRCGGKAKVHCFQIH
jgi:hypothetical protein